MKKLFTLFVALLAGFALHAQIVLTENFSGGVVPPTGWSVSGQNTNWRISQTANAGGAAPEGRLTWTPQFNTTTRLISPALNLSGQTLVMLRFKHMVDFYAANFQIGIATRNSSSGTWNNVWTQTVTSDIPAKQEVIIIENADVNSATFQFSLFFTGNSFNVDDWYFDDFELSIPYLYDAALTTLDVPNYFLGNQNVSGKVTNLGLFPITSYTLNWSLNNGETQSTTFTGLNIATGASHNYLAQQQLNPPSGQHALQVWISNLNGNNADLNPSNDMITKTIGIPTQVLQRRPLFEEFTSSTCPPCATFNNSVFNPFIAQNGDNIALIKYQMNWPGSGDPYYTAEGGVRRTFYGVSAVPQLFAEGKGVATNAAAVNAAYNAGMNEPAFVHITGTHAINGTNITVSANITPYVTLSNVTLHVVVIEKLTTGNVGTNGETSFKHVMMKMFPNANGTTTNLEGGVTTNFTFTHNMATTFVEQMDDLIAVIFVQDHSNRYVFQSAYTVPEGQVAAAVTFDPVAGATGVTTEANLHILFDMPVFMVGGDAITNANVASLVTLKQVGGANFPFTATINDTKTTITVSPVGLLNSYTNYELGVAAVQNTNAVVTPASSITFQTGQHVGIGELTTSITGINPNPATDIVSVRYFLSDQNTASLSLIDVNGRLVREWNPAASAGANTIEIDVKDIPSGIYVLQLKAGSQSQNTRLMIAK